MIPFFDIRQENQFLTSNYVQDLKCFLESGQFVLGEAVTEFENQFADFCGSEYCVGTSNGLDALRLIFEGYKALGLLNDGDEVLVPAHTYIASILSVVQSGLVPVFVEPKPESYSMCVSDAQYKLTHKTKACLGVHLYGELMDVEGFQKFTSAHNLLFIEDAAQAHGAVSKDGHKAGAIGHAAAFSFYPTKNIGALGDAGAVTTHDHNLERIMRRLQNYGSTKKNQHDLLGFNMRLDSLQARFLSSKLEVYPNQLKRRQEIAKRYLNEVNNPKLSLPKYLGDGSHVFHLFVVRVKDRKQFTNFLTRHNIGSLIHYPIPPHKQKSLKDFNNLSLPITELYHKEVVSIPLYPSLADEKITSIIEILNTY